MARIAFCLPALPSHAAVHGVLASCLAARGHAVSFVGSRNLADLARRQGVDFDPLGFTEPDISGAGLLRTLWTTARSTQHWCAQGPAHLAALAPDLVIADQAEPGASLAAEAAGVARITLASALPLDRDEAIPPPFVNWPFLEGEEGRKRNAGGWKVADALLMLQRRALAKGCRDHNLTRRNRMSDWISPDLDLRQMIPALDFPHALLSGARPVGPLRSPEARSLDLASEGRPIVFASLGTLSGPRRRLLDAICAAGAQMPITLLIAHGGNLRVDEVPALPPHIHARPFWPQAAVLQRASACITHAGLNTALDCVAAHVPMVAIPLAFEQPATAARLAHHGVARVIPPRRADARAIRDALHDVLENPSYRRALDAPSSALAQAGGAPRAADLVEAVLRRQTLQPLGQTA